jgi:hypothetical protein
MSERLSKKQFLDLLFKLEPHEQTQRASLADGRLDPQLAMLRAWQAERLKRTYADLLADDRYRPACLFILSDIYGPHDFSQRDHDAEQLYAWLSRLLPERMLVLLSDAIRMNQLTDRLDRTLLGVLVGELGVTDHITPPVYAEGFRRCDNYAERLRQVNLMEKILLEVGKGTRNPLVGPALKLARAPAERAGWMETHDFLQRGYAALRHLRDVHPFIQVITRREVQIMDKIFAGESDPFSL